MTTFITDKGHYRFKRLICGINTAGKEFQRCLNSKISDLKGVVDISDGIICHGKNKAEHDEILKQLFYRLHKHGFKINAHKCIISKSSIESFGMITFDKGINPDPRKVSILKNSLPPKSKSELQSFLRFCTFMSSFITNFSDKATPLRELIKKGAPYEWKENHQQAFDLIKNELTGKDLMMYFNTNKKLVLLVDVSDYALGGIFLQENSAGYLQPITYISRALTKYKTKYSPTEMEALGLVWGIDKLHLYLYHTNFHVIVGHGSKIYI